MAHTVSSVLTDETLNRIMAIESRGKLKAKAPTSSAFGPFQFLNGTWLQVVKQHRPDLLHGRTQTQVLALRSDPTIGIELGARFTEDNARGLGDGFTDGDLYLAHFLGLGAARKFFRAAGNASSAALAGPEAVRANKSIFAKNKTAAALRAWAQHSMVSRWDEAGHVDWVKQFYVPDPTHEPIPVDDAPPVKTEVNFEDTADAEADAEDEVTPAPRRAPAPEPADTDEGSSIAVTIKTMFKSKIAWLAGSLGLGGAGSSVNGDPETQTLLMQLAHKPAFWLIIASIVIAGAIIYFRWKDHGRGALK